MSSIKPTRQNQPVVYHNPPKQTQAIPKNPPASRHLPQQAKQLRNPPSPSHHQKSPTRATAGMPQAFFFPLPIFFCWGREKLPSTTVRTRVVATSFTTEDAVKAVGDVEVIKDEHSAVQRKEYARCGHRYQSCGHATPKQRRRLPSPPTVLFE